MVGLNLPQAAPAAGYPALFRRFIANSLDFALAEVQNRALLSDAERKEALRSLAYGLEEASTRRQTVALLLALAPHQLRAGWGEEWSHFLERGLSIAVEPDHRAEIAYHLGELAQYQGHAAQAEDHFAASVAEFAQAGRIRQQARSLNRLAYALRLQQRQPEARRLAADALALLDSGDPEWAYSHFVLGVIAFDQGDAQAAADCLSTALAGWELNGSDEHRADGLVNLAPALRRLGRFDEAIAALKEAGQHFARRRNPRREGLVCLNLGNIYLSQERWAEALARFQPAEQLFRQVGDDLHAAINFNNMGVACRRLGRLEEAERAFLLAIAGFEEMDQPVHHINALDGLGNTYRDCGRMELAVETYQRALARAEEAADPAPLQPLAAEVRTHLAGLLHFTP
ncbi:MAG: tetratricopeptide repeat protein [Caldilineaceae bacterium]|nr:tetratricopeptide repeat protein [Caldilineaceae bacterium]